MKKRILAILLTLCIMLGMAPAVFAVEVTSGTCGENVSWLFDSESGTLTISGTGEMYYAPGGHYDFSGIHESVKTIIIESGVTSVGGWAFNHFTNLTSVTLPPTVNKIELYAFYNCESLTNFTIPNGVTIVGAQAFDRCKNLTSITIPTSVTCIDEANLNENLTDIYYGGSQADWEKIVTYSYVSPTTTIHFAEDTPSTPSKPSTPSTPVEPEPPVSSNFTDVPADAYYADAVAWAVKNGITTGMTETTFAPENNCTRAQAVTFLWRAAGKPEPKSANNPFTDVVDTKDTNWYFKAVQWAVEQGITTGTTATTFSPDVICNRAQIVTFLYRHAGEPAANSGTFSDVTADQYYYQAVQWATEKNITNGMGNGKFEPGTDCSRGHIVTFLYRDMVK